MIPTAVLPDVVDIDPLTGITGTGAPAYGTRLADKPAKLVTDAKTIRDRFGDDHTAGAMCQVRPGMAIPVGSLVTAGADRYEVLEVRHVSELRRAHHDELLLEGPRPAP